MQRRNKGPSSPAASFSERDNHLDDNSSRRGRPSPTLPQRTGSSSSSGRATNTVETTTKTTIQPIIPLRVVFGICVFFLTAGWCQNAWEQGLDRKTASGPHKGGSTETQHRKGVSLLSEREDLALQTDADEVTYHVVFSTDCSPYQHWQSYLVFYTAMTVRQPGHVTRIASGCSEEEEQEMLQWFQNDVQYMSNRFHLQLTPKFSTILDSEGKSQGDYKFFNKPYGLLYWMEHSDLLHFNSKTRHFPAAVHDDIVILIDPDMAILRPLTRDFSNPRDTLVSPKRQQHKLAEHVSRGHPFAQVYGFGSQWTRLDLDKIAGKGTPASKVTPDDGRLYYAAGPPYLAVVSDMHAIATSWSAFVPGTYEQYPHLLAEMFAFSIAAAHLELPLQLIDSLMVSDVAAATGEGWALVEQLPADQLCGLCTSAGAATTKPSPQPHALPSTLHACQRYSVGEDWFFTKRRIPSDIYDCDAPLFQEPPADLAARYTYKHAPGGRRFELTEAEVKRQAFAICTIYSVINAAATFYKSNACVSGTTVNLAKSRSLVEYMEDEQKKGSH